jgi:hypothetical protein
MPDRFVLADQVKTNLVEQAAYLLKWSFNDASSRPGDQVPTTVWTTPEKTTVLYVQDPICGVRYMIVNGKDTSKTVADIKRVLEPYSRDELLDDARKAKGFSKEAEAGRRLIVGIGERYDGPAFVLLRDKFFRHKDARIRADMIKCFAYAGWIEFRPLIEEMAAKDPRADVRRFAKDALEALELQSAGELES